MRILPVAFALCLISAPTLSRDYSIEIMAYEVEP